MSGYQTIPRKYRPQRFADVVGHEAIVATLKNALTMNRIGQAYLFCGQRGTGKTSFARLFAKALNCKALQEDGEPCNQCTSCKEILENRSLDIIEIDGASNRGIDDVRQIMETVGYAPSSGKYKIYIIDEVHMLTKEAFNALLKTLEEPPATVKFFFATTEPHKVPATIASRCQRFDLGRLPPQTISLKLRRIATDLKLDIEEAALEQIAALSEGSMRDAEAMLDQLICFAPPPTTLAMAREAFGLLPHHFFFALDAAIHSGSPEQGLKLAAELFSQGKDIHATIDGLLEHFRTHLLQQMHGQPTLLTPEQKNHYRTQAHSKEKCLNYLDLLIDWQQRLSKTPFKRVHIEMLLISLIRLRKRIPLEELVERLVQLEHDVKETETPQPAPNLEPPPPEPVEVFEEPVAKLSEKIDHFRAGTIRDEEVADKERAEPRNFATSSEEKIIVSDSIEAKVRVTEEQTSKNSDAAEQNQSKAHRYDTLLRFAAVELEGTVKTKR